MTTPNNPVVNAGLLYVNGLQIVNTTYSTFTSTLFLNSGAARDITNTSDIILNEPITLDIRDIGANGLDFGTVAANAFYAVYAIGDSTAHNPTAGLFSLATGASPTPYLPLGYDMYRRVGWILTVGSEILPFSQLGDSDYRTYYYLGPFGVLSGGTSAASVPVNVSAIVPPINRNEVFLNVEYTPAAATNRLQLNDLTAGGVFSGGIIQFGYGVAGLQVGSVRMFAEQQQFLYRVESGDSVNLNVCGYTDYLNFVSS